MPMQGETYLPVAQEVAVDTAQSGAIKGMIRGGLKAVVVALALVACVGLAVGMSQSQSKVSSARTLLESPDVLNMVTEYHMGMNGRSRRHAGFREWEKARASIETHMRKRTAADSDVLDTVSLTEEEQEGLRHVLRHIGSNGVRKLAVELVRDSKDQAGNLPLEREHIAEHLRSHARALSQLHAEIFDGLPGRMSRPRNSFRQLQTITAAPVVTVAPVVGGVPVAPVYVPTTTPVNPLDCEQLEETFEEAEQAVNMFKLIAGDQVKKMSENSPIVKSIIDASDDIIDFFKCVNDLRKMKHGKGCKDDQPTVAGQTDELSMFTDANDAAELMNCWEEAEPAIMKVASAAGIDMGSD